MINEQQQQEFQQKGFLIARKVASESNCKLLLEAVYQALNPPLAPLEYEADVHYPARLKI